MSNAPAEHQSLSNACQCRLRIPKKPFGHSAHVSRTYPGIMPTIDEPMGLMSFRIIQPAPCVGVVASYCRLTSIKQRWRRCCTDRRVERSTPSTITLCDADGNRASQLQHVVQDMDGDGNLGGTTLVLATAQPVSDHLLVAPDGSLNPATRIVVRHLLPADPAFLSNPLQMAVALCGLGLGRLARHS